MISGPVLRELSPKPKRFYSFEGPPHPKGAAVKVVLSLGKYPTGDINGRYPFPTAQQPQLLERAGTRQLAETLATLLHFSANLKTQDKTAI